MEKQFSFGGAKIFYRVTGNGQPVLLLHGFGEDSTIWEQQINFLQDHCLLLIPDLPGSGKSDLLKEANRGDSKQSNQPIELTDYADCIRQLLLAEDISSCFLLGHSMGGYVTMAFAEKYPELLEGIGLIHSTAYADSAEKKKVRANGIDLMETYGGASFLMKTTPNLFAIGFKKKHPEIIDRLISDTAYFTTEALQQYYRAMMNRPDRRVVLKGNHLPVLFVIGTEDVAVPMDEMLEQTHLPFNSYIHVMKEVGHMSMLEQPDILNKLILAFIKKE